MFVSLKFFKGPKPGTVKLENVESICTRAALGYLMLVIHYREFGAYATYTTPLYLVADIIVNERK